MGEGTQPTSQPLSLTSCTLPAGARLLVSGMLPQHGTVGQALRV